MQIIKIESQKDNTNSRFVAFNSEDFVGMSINEVPYEVPIKVRLIIYLRTWPHSAHLFFDSWEKAEEAVDATILKMEPRITA